MSLRLQRPALNGSKLREAGRLHVMYGLPHQRSIQRSAWLLIFSSPPARQLLLAPGAAPAAGVLFL
jgi:hypothetical protein